MQMRVESIAFQRLLDRTPDNMAFRYIVGYTPMDMGFWWSDFVIKEIAFDRDYGIACKTFAGAAKV